MTDRHLYSIQEALSESTPLISGDVRTAHTAGVPVDVNHKRSNNVPPIGDASATTFNDHGEPSTSKSGSRVNLTLLNTGSVARDHLASERTHLAYVRTSLALSSAGVAVMQFLRLGERTKPFADIIGLLSLIVGMTMLIIGTRRFFSIQKSLVIGYFPASSFEMILMSFILGLLITVTFAIIILGRKG